MIHATQVSMLAPVVPLGQVAEFLDHLRKPVKESERQEGDYPYYGANGQQGTISDYLFDEPLVLLAEDGGYFDEPDRGVAYRVSGKTWVNNHAHVLRPKDKVDICFLARHLERYDLLPFVNGTTRSKLTKGNAERIPIWLPPLSEQRRIASILDKADAIGRKRQEGVRLTEELLHSTFLAMFGDPAANPKGWPMLRLEQISNDMTYGTSVKCDGENGGTALPVLRIPNILRGQIDWSDLKYASLESRETQQLLLAPGDLLFVRTNGNPEYIGRCAMFSGDTRALFASYLIRVRLKPDAEYRPEFVRFVATMPSYRSLLVAEARTTAGNYNISTQGLRRLKLIAPPLDQQDRFLRFAAETSKMLTKREAASAEATTLFDSLVQRAFRGEL